MTGLKSNSVLKEAVIKTQRSALETTHMPMGLRDFFIIQVGEKGFVIEEKTKNTKAFNSIGDNKRVKIIPAR